MEKFSTWRDAGTGIQPFLPPVPPVEASSSLDSLFIPFGWAAGILKALILLVAVILYGVGLLLSVAVSPIPPASRGISKLFTSISCRIALLAIGLWWIPVELVTRRRGRSNTLAEKWSPKAGDIIVSNWCSWVEVLYLAFRWNPIFVIPVASEAPKALHESSSSLTTPGRRTGTGSAAISSPGLGGASPATRSPILGFRVASLFAILHHTGKLPLAPAPGESTLSLEEIRVKSDRPVVVFPECTTSNGRALLRFAHVFDKSLVPPIKKFKLWVMCIRYDPPTAANPTLTHSIPFSLTALLPNPLPHILSILFSPTFGHTVSIKLVSPSDSPSSGAFVASDFMSSSGSGENVTDACAGLMAFAGKLKRASVLGWEDKRSFLDFYWSKR